MEQDLTDAEWSGVKVMGRERQPGAEMLTCKSVPLFNLFGEKLVGSLNISPSLSGSKYLTSSQCNSLLN